MVWRLLRIFKRRKKVVEEWQPSQPMPKIQPLHEQPTKPVGVRQVAEKRLHSMETEAVQIPKMTPIMPTDPEGRPFVAISKSCIGTEALITVGLADYCKYVQSYPEGIWLHRDRYARHPWDSFRTVDGRVIPLFCGDDKMTCHVLIYGPRAREARQCNGGK